MSAPAKKAPARKSPARKRAAATAARAEVRKQQGSKIPKIKVPFRGNTFEFTLDRLGNAKVVARQRALESFPNEKYLSSLLFEILGPVDSDRWINLMREGDTIDAAAAEFMNAIRKASNVPN